MTTLPMRLQSPSLHIPYNETCKPAGKRNLCMSAPPVQPEQKPSSSHNMSVAVLPLPRLSIPKRPKLSLQTSTIPQPFAPRSANALSIGHSSDSPTLRNTYENALKDTPAASSSAQMVNVSSQSSGSRGISELPRSSSSPLSSTETSPNVPYFLPIGARGILRNSPLPPRYVTATSTRTPHRMFPPVKRVVFHDKLEELMPTPIVEETSELSDTDSESSASSHKRGRASDPHDRNDSDDPEDMPSTPVSGRCKRRREWVWTIGSAEDGRLSPDAGPLLRRGHSGVQEDEDLPQLPSLTDL
ncbi:hypothetical protein MMC34_006876 [Xylographa carneopallida]|nr:hypothetical protein [Xylographa carneopallida]